MRRKTLVLSPSTSTPPLFSSVGSQGHGTGGGLVLARLGTAFRDGGLDKGLTLSQDRLLVNIESSQHLPITTHCLHPIVNQT